ncbi:MAG: hypothetical protein U0795_15575 [Pirellulales bacterium]
MLTGGKVWITADGTEVGKVTGCNPHQGLNVNPAYGVNQHVRAWFELCADRSPPSAEEVSQVPPSPLPAPGFETIHVGGEQLIINNIVNGAKVSVSRNGVAQGIWGCWGGRLQLDFSPPFQSTDTFMATQSMCAGDPASPPGAGSPVPCSELPAPMIGPVQGGDKHITVTSSAPGAIIKVWVNGVPAGTNSPPIIGLNTTLKIGDTVHIVQDLAECSGQTALEVKVACVDAPVSGNPEWLNLFPVGNTEYNDGAGVKGSVYYPAEDDGLDQQFNHRLANIGRVPIVVMAHGNHSPTDPSYLGYDYFQASLAKMGIIAVSVDCNALNGAGSGVTNIEQRADLIIDSIKHFKSLNTSPTSIFFGRIDFARLGLMGHSRGGDAVVTLPTVMHDPEVAIRGVLALAPTNFRFWSGLSTIAPSGHAFMTILPAGDGDVIDNNGAQFYDQATAVPYKSQLYVHFTCHNLFNRQWLFDEGSGPARISRADHEGILASYGSAFFRNVLLGHATDHYLAGYIKPQGVSHQHVYLSFEKQLQTTIDNHEDGNGVGVNSLGLATSQTGGLNANEFPFGQVAGAFNEFFFGESIGLVALAGSPSRVFRTAIGERDLRGREIWIRAAEVVVRRGFVPNGATGFKLGIEDVNGISSFVDVDFSGGLPRPYPHPYSTKTMLSTIRFKADCFAVGNRRLAVDRIRAVLIACDRSDERHLAFDDLQIVVP